MTSPGELGARVRALESRSQRYDEDLTVIMDTVVDTREDVKTLRLRVGRLTLDVDALTRKVSVMQTVLQKEIGGLKQDVGGLKHVVLAIATHLGLTVEPDDKRHDPKDE